MILLPTFIIKLVHQVYWYMFVSISIFGFESSTALNVLVCCITTLGWLYKTTVFLFMCVLFRLMCSLQILRLQGYIKLLERTTDVRIIMAEHMRIRHQLSLISHRTRSFLVISLFMITFSQLWTLLVLIESAKTLSFFRAGDLVVSYVTVIHISVIHFFSAEVSIASSHIFLHCIHTHVLSLNGHILESGGEHLLIRYVNLAYGAGLLIC
jgi:hypothetical protein